MMQPEDIIQQKEWSQLSQNEKASLAELAANEKEFNLLKKMLLVSAEEMEEVPLLDPAVKTAVSHHFTKKERAVWRYAAAAAIIIACGLLFTLRPPAHDPAVPIAYNNVPVSPKGTVIRPPVTVSPPAPADPKKIQYARSRPVAVPRKPVAGGRDIAVNNTIAAQKELLSLVTEVY